MVSPSQNPLSFRCAEVAGSGRADRHVDDADDSSRSTDCAQTDCVESRQKTGPAVLLERNVGIPRRPLCRYHK
jgi:hypothetical protein